MKSSIIDKESVNRVISVLLQAEAAAEEDSGSVSSHSAIRVIDAFLVPKLRYDSVKKHFYQYVYVYAIFPIYYHLLCIAFLKFS